MPNMADCADSHSGNSSNSSPRQGSEASDPKGAGSVASKPTTRSASKASISVAADKDALCRQKALEKQFAKVQKQAEAARSNPVPVPAIEANTSRA